MPPVKLPERRVQLARYANSRKRNSDGEAIRSRRVASRRRSLSTGLSSRALFENRFFLFSTPAKEKSDASARLCFTRRRRAFAGNFALAACARTTLAATLPPRLFHRCGIPTRARSEGRARERENALAVKEHFFLSPCHPSGEGGSDASFMRAVCKQPDFRSAFPTVAFFPVSTAEEIEGNDDSRVHLDRTPPPRP